MKSIALLFAFVLCFVKSQIANAQIPTTCFEIQSILVAACGTNAGGLEGENEMVRFITGPNALNTSNLNVNWPNGGNLWLGVIQNATTAAKVATINSTIIHCGYVREPVGGILPPGSTVILVTSTNMNPTYNSFANLSDTIYMIFQTAGNTSGHFKNYGTTPPLTRTLSMNFGSGCSDAVTYRIDNLLDQSGQPGSGEGATVVYNFAGVATYTNPGCQAPFSPLNATLSSNPSNICAGDLINLNATINNNNYTSFFWSGGAGVYGNTSSLNTTYQTSNSFSGIDHLQFGIIDFCGDTFYSPLDLSISTGNSVTITSGGSSTFCEGNTLTLTAQVIGILQSTFQWSTGANTNSIVVDTTNTYTVTATNICGSSTASQSVTEVPNTPVTITASSATTFCNGGSVTLSASGGGPYAWSTGAVANSIVVYNTSVVSVTGNPVCGSNTAQQTITVINPPIATINGNTVICPDHDVDLTASGGDNYQWSSGETTAGITVNIEGDYIVTATNLCGSDTESVDLIQSTLSVSFIADTLSGAAPLPVTFISNISNANTYQWNFGDGGFSSEINPTHIFSSGGLYTVILSVEDQNGCTATYSEDISVIDETGIFAPAAFTPDGDGLNDLFIIKGAGITSLTTIIYNRWGQAINSYHKLSDGWNGNDTNNQPEPEGIYGYLAYVSLTNGDTKKLRGSVLLLR